MNEEIKKNRRGVVFSQNNGFLCYKEKLHYFNKIKKAPIMKPEKKYNYIPDNGKIFRVITTKETFEGILSGCRYERNSDDIVKDLLFIVTGRGMIGVAIGTIKDMEEVK